MRDSLDRYLRASRRPLPILVFLLPLVIVYELGLAWVLRSSDGVLTNKAHETFLRFFEVFGINVAGGLYLGGALIIVVLLVWHLLTRESWKIDLATPGVMAVESILLSVPLLVFAAMVGRGEASAAMAMAPQTPLPTDLGEYSLWSRLAISIGAGLYEELLFRMLLIAVIHTILVDVGKMKPAGGAGLALIVSAIAFTIYHPLSADGGGLDLGRVLFYFGAGLYFGGLFLGRGFGIVVGVHAVYDVIVLSMIRPVG